MDAYGFYIKVTSTTWYKYLITIKYL
jgi:hypothetical protein